MWQQEQREGLTGPKKDQNRQFYLMDGDLSS